MSENKLSELGRVESIALLYEGTGYVPFSDAGFAPSPKANYCTQASKVLLEGIDFDLTYFPLKHLGYKSVVAVTGELYARLATPRSLDVRLGISAKLDYDQVKEIWDGIVTAAREHGYVCVSLDLGPSYNGLCIAVSASGETSLQRPPAKSKDLICVSNNLGAAYLGFSILEQERKSFARTQDDKKQPDLADYKHFIGAYLKPSLNPNTLQRLQDAGIVPSFGYFVTRGLSDTIKSLARDSSFGAKIYVDKIPFEGNTFDLGKKLNIDPMSAALNGGDDFRLVFVIPLEKHETFCHDFQDFDIIGHLARPEVGAVLVTPDGVELPLRSQGWKDEDL